MMAQACATLSAQAHCAQAVHTAAHRGPMGGTVMCGACVHRCRRPAPPERVFLCQQHQQLALQPAQGQEVCGAGLHEFAACVEK
jgi:hypothetical protein